MIEWEEFEMSIAEKSEHSSRKSSAPDRKESREHKGAIK